MQQKISKNSLRQKGENMNIYHNSQDENYRFPKGAVKTNETVRLSLKVEADMPPDSVRLRLWDNAERYVEMLMESRKIGEFWYTAELLMPNEPGLLWYFFEIDFHHQGPLFNLLLINLIQVISFLFINSSSKMKNLMNSSIADIRLKSYLYLLQIRSSSSPMLK